MHNQAHRLYGSSFTLYGWLVCVWALITPFQHGYHTSVLNQVEDVLTCKQTSRSNIQSISLPECIPMTDVTFSLITSIYTIGGLTGSLLAKYVMDRTGRRGANCIGAFLVVVGTTVMALAGNVASLLAGRFLIGVASGLGLCVTPIYLSEISPEKISGKIGMFTQLSIVIGIMVTEVVGLGLVGPSKTQSLLNLNFSSASISPPSTWRYVFLPSSALSALQLLVSITIVESPSFLLKSRTQSEDEIPDPDSASATEESPLLLNRDDARSHEGAETEPSPTEEKLSVRQLLKQKDLRNPLSIVCLAMIAQQVSGINPVLYYSNDILSKSLPTLSAYVSLGITVLNALVTVPAVLLVEKLGRKKLLAISTAGALLSLAVLGYSLDSAQNGTARIISSVAIIMFVISFAFGMGPVPFVLIPEVSPANAISALSSVGLSISWITNCLVGFAFLPLRNWLSGGEASKEGRVFYVIVVLLAVPAGMLFRVYKPSN
ncbi:general substrate transporter [Agrocybe pediades]|nr:general substrate transporter [Agrocybe pediades]